MCNATMISHLQLKSGGVKRYHHATTERHSEDRHPDAWGLPPAHTAGPGNGTHVLVLEAAQVLNCHKNLLTIAAPFQTALLIQLASVNPNTTTVAAQTFQATAACTSDR